MSGRLDVENVARGRGSLDILSGDEYKTNLATLFQDESTLHRAGASVDV